MGFILLILFTAFLMEAVGTFVSVYGLGALFAGDPVILAMAVILDIAKIVSVSFIYQHWNKILPIMKYYMVTAVIILMTITSAGAFGYLSGAFQKAVQPVMQVSLKVDSFKHERDQLTSEKVELTTQRAEIDKQIAQLPSDYVRSRQRLITSFKPEQDHIRERVITITKRIDELNQQVLTVESENIEKEVHVGPIMYIAKAFDISIEQASKWIILTIIFVFDPLAIILIIAGNFLIKLRQKPDVLPTVAAILSEASPKPNVAELISHITPENLPEPPLYETVSVDEDLEPITVDFENPTVTTENSIPTIDVTGDSSYSGSPQSDLIDKKPLFHSSLEKVTFSPDVLLPHSIDSTKKSLYE